MDDPFKLIGVVVGAVTVFAGAARWLISKYFETQKQLEALKEQNTKDALTQLNTLSAGLRTGLSDLSDELKELRVEIEALRSLAQKLQDSQVHIEKKIRPFSNKKLVRISSDLFAFKEKE
jgi:chromosome segregation ATPase